MFLSHPRVKVTIVGSPRDREVACSASDRQGSNFESCVWRTVSSHTSHHPQEVLLAQFNLYVHKGGIKPDSFHLVDVPFTNSRGRDCVDKLHCIFNGSVHFIIQINALYQLVSAPVERMINSDVAFFPFSCLIFYIFDIWSCSSNQFANGTWIRFWTFSISYHL